MPYKFKKEPKNVLSDIYNMSSDEMPPVPDYNDGGRLSKLRDTGARHPGLNPSTQESSYLQMLKRKQADLDLFNSLPQEYREDLLKNGHPPGQHYRDDGFRGSKFKYYYPGLPDVADYAWETFLRRQAAQGKGW